MDPAFISMNDAARYTGESLWTVKERLRSGIYKAKKAGRRTLVVFASVKEYADKLPDAEFGPAMRGRRGKKAA
jgi:hypothetical protein